MILVKTRANHLSASANIGWMNTLPMMYFSVRLLSSWSLFPMALCIVWASWSSSWAQNQVVAILMTHHIPHIKNTAANTHALSHNQLPLCKLSKLQFCSHLVESDFWLGLTSCIGHNSSVTIWAGIASSACASYSSNHCCYINFCSWWLAGPAAETSTMPPSNHFINCCCRTVASLVLGEMMLRIAFSLRFFGFMRVWEFTYWPALPTLFLQGWIYPIVP